MQHEGFLSDILESTQDTNTVRYFSMMEEQVEDLHRKNFSDLADEKEQLQTAAKELIHLENDLLQERKRTYD